MIPLFSDLRNVKSPAMRARQPLRLVCRVHVEIHGTQQANFFYARKEVKSMASYAFATLQARQTLQELWEQGKTVKDMAEALDVPLSTLYTELRRGRSGVRLPDQRLQYDATLAQLRMQQELERRGKQSR